MTFEEALERTTREYADAFRRLSSVTIEAPAAAHCAHCAHCGALHRRRLLKPVQGGWLCKDYAACEWLRDLGKAQCIHGTPADESCWACDA